VKCRASRTQESLKSVKLIRKWLHGYRTLALIMAISSLSGCTRLPDTERQTLIRASDMYSRGETTSAVKKLDQLINDYHQTNEIAEAYYLRGLCRIRNGQDLPAIEDFERAIQKSTRDDLTALCRASMAALAYKRGDWGKAAELYKKAIPDLPDRSPTDVILYCAGISFQRIGKWRDAAYQFGRILRKFRSRPIASDARRMAGWKYDYYSIQLGAFKHADNATDAVRSYRAKNLEAWQEFLPRNGGGLWVVMSGRYPTYAQARSALSHVRKTQAEAIIIPY